jgi:signal transduction histidine kinase
MPTLQAARFTERGLLRVLIGGFSLVVALLGLAGWVAVRSTRAIEADAAQVGREQLAMARLLNDVQAGQNTLAVILHQLAPGADAADREALLRELETADKALARAGEAASGTPEARLWHDLNVAAKEFSTGVRSAIHRGGSLPASELVPLFELHDKVVRIEQQLLETSEERMASMERRIETESRNLASNARILLGACLTLALLCAVLTILFAQRSIRRIEWQASELSRVSWHLLQTQESAARRFSHELHDELGQSLAAVKANLTAANPQEWVRRRADCISLVDASIANVRELSQLLHPVILDDFGLDAGLRWLAARFQERTGIRTDYVSNFEGRLPDEIETHLFRIAQEALTNVARHSGAKSVVIEIGSLNGMVELSIGDDGKGMKEEIATPEQPSLGMTGMRARTREIGGQFHVESTPGRGLTIRVRAPRADSSAAVEKTNEPHHENTHPVGG